VKKRHLTSGEASNNFMRWPPKSNQVRQKIVTPKIELGVAKYIILEVAKHKYIPTNSIYFFFWVAIATPLLYKHSPPAFNT